MNYPKSFENLIYEFEKLPGIGQKMAVRIGMKLYKNRLNSINLIQSIQNLTNLHTCEFCGAISDDKVCEICADNQRDKSKLMVVEDYLDLLSIESSKEYDGYYFILGGLISPMNGVMPNDLNILGLINRIKYLSEQSSSLEIVFSLNPNMEGEGTIYFIKQEIDSAKVSNLTFSKLALGVPKGADIDFVDSETLKFALRSRGDI